MWLDYRTVFNTSVQPRKICKICWPVRPFCLCLLYLYSTFSPNSLKPKNNFFPLLQLRNSYVNRCLKYVHLNLDFARSKRKGQIGRMVQMKSSFQQGHDDEYFNVRFLFSGTFRVECRGFYILRIESEITFESGLGMAESESGQDSWGRVPVCLDF